MGRDLVANEVVAKGRRWLHYKLPLVEFIVLSVFLWKFEKLFKADPGSGAHNCLPHFRGIRRFIFYSVLGYPPKLCANHLSGLAEPQTHLWTRRTPATVPFAFLRRVRRHPAFTTSNSGCEQ